MPGKHGPLETQTSSRHGQAPFHSAKTHRMERERETELGESEDSSSMTFYQHLRGQRGQRSRPKGAKSLALGVVCVFSDVICCIDLCYEALRFVVLCRVCVLSVVCELCLLQCL